jgi:tetratricopeptide (TPR) repeat protein
MIRRRWPDLLPVGDIPDAQRLQDLFWSYSIRRRPFYVELPQKLGGRPYRNAGLVYVVDPDPKAPWSAVAERAWATYALRGDRVATHHDDFFTQHLLGYYAAAHSNLGLQLAEERRWPEAVAQYKAALLIDPKLAAAYNNWAIAYFNQGQYAQAIPLYQRAVRLEPANPGFRANLRLAEEALAQAPTQKGG